MCCKINETLDFKKTFNMPGISKYHSIVYDGEKINFFQYYGIGTGVKKEIKDLISKNYNFDHLKLKVKTAKLEIEFNSSLCTSKPNKMNISEKKKKVFFDCTECDLVFPTERDLEDHDNCHEQLETTQLDKLQLIYADYCKNKRIFNLNEEKNSKTYITTNDFKEILQQGYAIKVRESNRFSEQQKEYLKK